MYSGYHTRDAMWLSYRNSWCLSYEGYGGYHTAYTVGIIQGIYGYHAGNMWLSYKEYGIIHDTHYICVSYKGVDGYHRREYGGIIQGICASYEGMWISCKGNICVSYKEYVYHTGKN